MRILRDDGDTIVYEDDDGRTFVVHRSKRKRRSAGRKWQPNWKVLLPILFFALIVATCF